MKYSASSVVSLYMESPTYTQKTTSDFARDLDRIRLEICGTIREHMKQTSLFVFAKEARYDAAKLLELKRGRRYPVLRYTTSFDSAVQSREIIALQDTGTLLCILSHLEKSLNR